LTARLGPPVPETVGTGVGLLRRVPGWA